MEIKKQPPIVHTAYNPVVVNVADTTNPAAIKTLSITTDFDTIPMKRYPLNGNVLFEISSILKSLFTDSADTSPVSDQIEIPHAQYIDYTLEVDNQTLVAETTTLMTGESSNKLKTFGGGWAITKADVEASMYFDNKNYLPDGSESVSAADNFIISIKDDSPYLKNRVHPTNITPTDFSQTYNGNTSENDDFAGGFASYNSNYKMRNSDPVPIGFRHRYGISNPYFDANGNITALDDCTINIVGTIEVTAHVSLPDAVNVGVDDGIRMAYFQDGSVLIGTEKVDITFDMIQRKSSDFYGTNTLYAYIPINKTLSLSKGDVITPNITFHFYGPEETEHAVGITTYNQGDVQFSSVSPFSVSCANKIPSIITSYILFPNIVNPYFSFSGIIDLNTGITYNCVINPKSHGLFRIQGSYVIVIACANATSTITPASGKLSIVKETIADPDDILTTIDVDITTNMWNIVGNQATITIPNIDASFSTIITDTIYITYTLSQVISSNQGGVVSASSESDFIFSYTEPPTAYPDGVNFMLSIFPNNGKSLYSAILNKSAIQQNSRYQFSLAFENIFNSIASQQLTFGLYEIRESEVTDPPLIASTKAFYVNDPDFLSLNSREYKGMPFYYQNKNFTAINAVAQLAESSDLTPLRGTFLTRLDQLLLYPGYPRQVTCLGFTGGTYVNRADTLLNPDSQTPVTQTLFNVQLTDGNDYIALSNQYPGHYLQAGSGEVITTNQRGEIITIARPATGYTEHRLTIQNLCLPINPFYVRWINRQGGYDYWMFSFRQTIKEKVKITDSYYPVVYDQLTANAFSRTLGLDGTATITVGTNGLTENEYDAVSKVIYAPGIQYFDTRKSTWITLAISDSDVEKDTYASTQEIEITFQLPTPQVQF
ncbi:MAG: hypothetical protein P4L28_11930 [Paludibacteraceae bacterium]|nr:hypothetical protein [Paludibacteraceae bacterium]